MRKPTTPPPEIKGLDVPPPPTRRVLCLRSRVSASYGQCVGYLLGRDFPGAGSVLDSKCIGVVTACIFYGFPNGWPVFDMEESTAVGIDTIRSTLIYTLYNYTVL